MIAMYLSQTDRSNIVVLTNNTTRHDVQVAPYH